ncbi:MAG: outer membrane beta-barrel protein [Bacteroidales bacterium]|nr:outer membrane beta-barrel protein [Bacteroidales bacterium]
METDRKLAELIRQSLAEYEEAYVPGSWEKFTSRQRKRQRRKYWLFAAGAAACFFMILLGGIVTNSRFQVQEEKNRSDRGVPGHSIRPEAVSSAQTSVELVVAAKETYSQEKMSTGKPTPIKSIHTEDVLLLSNRTDSTQTSIKKTIPDSVAIAGKEGVVPVGIDAIADGSIGVRTRPLHREPFNKEEAPNPEKLSLNRKIRLGVNVSSGFNSTPTAVTSNYACGVNAEIPLSRRFSISTGLSFERQNVSENDQENVSLTSDRSRAELMNVDIPMNLTWKFITGKVTSYYLSGGISSLAYLKEKYVNTAYKRQVSEISALSEGVETMTYKVVQSEITTESTVKPFQTFDFAGRINLIFGMEQRLWDHLYLQLEPFVKIPVSGLATQDLKYVTSGIACKVSF